MMKKYAEKRTINNEYFSMHTKKQVKSIPGLFGDYFDPITGAVFLLTGASSFTERFHEYAHSYLNQTTFLGHIINLFSSGITALIHDQFYISSQYNRDDLLHRIEIGKRLFLILEEILRKFHFTHEIFATSVEMIGKKENNVDTIGDSYSEYLKEVLRHNRRIYRLKHSPNWKKTDFSIGSKLHNVALDFILYVYKIFGRLEIAQDVAYTITSFLPFTINNIEVDELFKEPIDKIESSLPNPNLILEEFLYVAPMYNPPILSLWEIKYFDFILKNCNSQSKYGSLINSSKTLIEWINALVKHILQEGVELEDFRFHFHLKGHVNKFRKDEFPKEHVEFLTKQKNEFKEKIENRIIISRLLGGDIGDLYSFFHDRRVFNKEANEKINHSPYTLIPPVTFYKSNGVLTMEVRSDLFDSDGLMRLSLHLKMIKLCNLLVNFERYSSGNNVEYPLFCFCAYFESDFNECDKGFGVCSTWLDIELAASFVKKEYNVVINPTIVCCRNGTAKVVSLLDFKKGVKYMRSYRFEMKEVKPKLYGIKYSNYDFNNFNISEK